MSAAPDIKVSLRRSNIKRNQISLEKQQHFPPAARRFVPAGTHLIASLWRQNPRFDAALVNNSMNPIGVTALWSHTESLCRREFIKLLLPMRLENWLVFTVVTLVLKQHRRTFVVFTIIRYHECLLFDANGGRGGLKQIVSLWAAVSHDKALSSVISFSVSSRMGCFSVFTSWMPQWFSAGNNRKQQKQQKSWYKDKKKHQGQRWFMSFQCYNIHGFYYNKKNYFKNRFFMWMWIGQKVQQRTTEVMTNMTWCIKHSQPLSLRTVNLFFTTFSSFNMRLICERVESIN